MKLEETRPGVFEATMTAHELSAILAGARMSLALMETDASGATEEARKALAAVLADFDAALERRLRDLLLGRAEQPRGLLVEIHAVPAARRAGHGEPDQLLVLVRDRRLVG